MHKEVNSILSITLIFLLAVAVFIFSQSKLQEISSGNYFRMRIKNTAKSASPTEASSQTGPAGIPECQDRFYEGDVQIKVWRDGEPVDSGTKDIIVRVHQEDVAKLPIISNEEVKNNFKAKMADVTQEVEMEINKHSENDPAMITVKGFKYCCEGMSYLSLDIPSKSLKNI